MRKLIEALAKLFWSVPGLKGLEKKRRRERYEFLKAKISERHFGGFRGMIVNFPGRRFDKFDFGCFPSPMYFWVKNRDGNWVVFWDHARMTREIGTGKPLQDGEALIPDTPGRSKPQAEPEQVDEQKPLTIPVAKEGSSDGATEN